MLYNLCKIWKIYKPTYSISIMGKVKKEDEKVIVKSISILPEQEAYVQSHFLNLSKFVQSKLSELIDSEKKATVKK